MKNERFAQLVDEALYKGGIAAGRFAASRGKTDLAQMTPDEYHKFIGVVWNSVAEDLRDRVAAEAIPTKGP